MTEPSARRPYRGSCMCGAVQYIIFLRFPHSVPPQDGRKVHQKFLKCNCTACHKAGVLHTRVPSPPGDFLVLAPRGDPLAELGDYQRVEGDGDGDGYIHWLFCRTCAARCFLFIGEGENVELDLDALGVTGRDGEKLGVKMVWRPKAEGWDAQGQHYLSVNAYTIDAAQEGLDLRELTEQKGVMYVDALNEKDEDRYERPHVFGSY